ncbi:glutamine-fructose-6-phosphate transaminase (isomerizing) [Oribacterium sp. oral taxon 078 str. F0262]|uniref:glutamine--fructose-6-phosphate transaminase (isomerizing) n=1 Tax=Oribacterium sp. oral taxon 078 TaxID=652706 RepID=UPI0001BCBD06|nr:glutamine--fructose-6-phosphate transaminase (isomerizing) [Oribacterium sp. oral taxon 078]EFE90348.1 glutamine-fructose-6-phosphate transaminase (isomerizing) [Oribacterium sp. oral taxon 078 str. F0262]
MCGIVGYVGRKQAGPLLLDGLSRLEYRGYDSAGIAVFREDGGISISKAVGKLSNLIKKTEGGALLPGRCGIGHTRWATHGAPSEQNAHPHVSMHGGVTLVHNGIIENDRELREELLGEGFRFYSETDTEVAANYIEYCFDRAEGDPKQAIRRFMERARGSYALAILFQGRTDEIWAVRKDSPMIIGRGEDGCCLASDVQAILKYSDSACYIGNREIARLTERGISFFDEKGRAIEKEMGRIEMDGRAAEKGIYPHFMLKEIHEQPAAVEETLRSMLRDGRISLSGIGISDSALQKLRSVWIVACGSAFYAGTALQYGIEALAGILVRTELASEFRYRKPLLSPEDLVILISQSGETADTLAALREAKLRGASTLAIVNVPGSSIAREADYVLYTLAGPEVSVATTKAYSAQLMAGYILCLALARARGRLTRAEEERLTGALRELPEKISLCLSLSDSLSGIAERCRDARDVFFLGRGIDYAAGLEAALKLKELSYIHAEAYAAGELKHGAISLIEEGVPVIGILSQPELFEKMRSNMAEVKSRGGCLYALFMGKDRELLSGTDGSILLPETEPLFSASLSVIPLQLLAYRVSVLRGLDVDRPRNLAKSVTVE